LGWTRISASRECQLCGEKARFLTLEKCKQSLISLSLATAFQADDEGSIPFTRSSVFKGLVSFGRKV
jgi:hypothetical protein